MKQFDLVFAILLLTGCAAPEVVQNTNYKDKDLSKRDLTILPIPDDGITVLNKDDVEDDFDDDKRKPESILQDEVYKTILKASLKSLKRVHVIDTQFPASLFPSRKDTSQFFQVIARVRKDTTVDTFYVPRKAMLESHHITPDIALCINTIEFGRNLTEPGPARFVPGNTVSTPYGSFQEPGHFENGRSSEYLGSNFFYVIWDYKENQAITYGLGKHSSMLMLGMTNSTWKDNFKYIGVEIFKNSPFFWDFYAR